MPIQGDFDVFLNEDEFAVKVQAESPARTFLAIFEGPGVVARIGGVAVETTTPTLTTAASSVAGFVRGETTITVPGHADPFTFLGAIPDGTGWVTVELAP